MITKLFRRPSVTARLMQSSAAPYLDAVMRNPVRARNPRSTCRACPRREAARTQVGGLR
jgi:hypothetical protein